MNAEQIERNWLLLESGELSTAEAQELRTQMAAQPECATVQQINASLLSDAEAALAADTVAAPLPGDQRETILTAATEILGNQRVTVRANPTAPAGLLLGLPKQQWLAVAATLVLLVGAGFLALPLLQNNPTDALAGTDPTAPAVQLAAEMAESQEEALTRKLALDKEEWALSSLSNRDVESMLDDLALLSSINI